VQETIETYDQIAAEYAARTFGLRLADQMARFVALLEPGARVLDVGCGHGRDVAWLAEQGFEAWGIDRSASQLLQGVAHGVGAPLIQADMACLPFRSGSFRGVWLCASLLHIPRAQVSDVLCELARVVRPGVAFVAVKRGQGSEWVHDARGRRRYFVYYDADEIQRHVERAGFEVLECWETQDLAGRDRPWIEMLAQCGIEA
jgi:ubiquinone/menaquinone biosynthesis C-methylase UbiE